MVKSITIGGKHMTNDYRLIPQGRLVVAEPEPKTNYVDVSGTDGMLDLTTALTGSVLYGNRTGEWNFMAANRYQDPRALMHNISNYLHGRRLPAILDDDPKYYYMGRFAVEIGEYNRGFTQIIIHYNLEPYKYDIYSSLDDWLWDPFCFETDIIREYKDLVVPCELTIPGSARPCIPKITCSGAMTVTYKGTTYSLSAGDNRNVNILIGEDEETLTFAGSGTVSVDYRGGWL